MQKNIIVHAEYKGFSITERLTNTPNNYWSAVLKKRIPTVYTGNSFESIKKQIDESENKHY